MERRRLLSIEDRTIWLADVVKAAEIDQERGTSLIPPEDLQAIKKLRQDYAAVVSEAERTTTARKKAVAASKEAMGLLITLVRQSFNTLDQMVLRGDLAAADRGLFKNPAQPNHPKSAQYKIWIVIAEDLIRGNQSALAQGLPAIQDPTPERLSEAHRLAKDALMATQDAKGADLTAVSKRKSFHKPIQKMHSMVAAGFKMKLYDQPAGHIRERLRDYGYRFFNRPNP